MYIYLEFIRYQYSSMKQISAFLLWLIITATSGYSQVINWQAAAGGVSQSWPRDMVVTPDSGFIIAVSLTGIAGFEVIEPFLGGDDFWVVKYNSKKKIQWQKRLGGALDDFPKNILVARDGGYFVSGTSNSYISGNKTEHSYLNDAWVIKLDSLGNILWQNTIRASGEDFLKGTDTTNDNGVILSILTYSAIGMEKTVPLVGQRDSWLVKLDSLGVVQWQNVVTVPGATEVLLNDIKQVPGGGYAAVGNYNINNYTSALFRLDSLGNVLWFHNIASSGSDYPLVVLNTTDKGFLIAYNSCCFHSYGLDLFPPFFPPSLSR